MEVLVLGASGLLGSNVTISAQERDHYVFGTFHSSKPNLDVPLEPIDIQNEKEIGEMLHNHSFDLLVNCAAITDVDYCESNKKEVMEVNGRAPIRLAEYCSQTESKFVHVSTDYVFSGKQQERYSESDQTNPIQVYGQSKLIAETGIIETNSNALIIRPSYLYGIHRSTQDVVGFPAWVEKQLTSGNQPSLFTDQYITPSRAGQTASILFELVEKEVSGIIHVASQTCISPADFGRKIANRIGISENRIENSSMSKIQRAADRPKYTCLDVRKVESHLNRHQPTLDEDLNAIYS